ncbi:MAG TPA: FxLYD domain-containing protein, partial [Lacipirellulaceae bacterium]|nr:FxLYD domain-containing protein [Lacipirellulaceae bacterium]
GRRSSCFRCISHVHTRSVTGPFGERFVTGAVRNNTDRSYSQVRVDITLLDADGNVVQNIFAITNDLRLGETWEFEVPVRAVDVVRAVLDGERGRQHHFHSELVTPQSRE